jgi:dGTP triphosphohydrolase
MGLRRAARTRRPAALVCDYVAGMTDRFAIEHRKLFQLDTLG